MCHCCPWYPVRLVTLSCCLLLWCWAVDVLPPCPHPQTSPVDHTRAHTYTHVKRNAPGPVYARAFTVLRLPVM